MSNILITGTSRGLGLEFVRQYLQEGWRVFATCRKNSAALKQLKMEFTENLCELYLDVTCSQDYRALRENLSGTALDVIIHNAGVNPEKFTDTFSDLTASTWLETFHINTVAPLLLTAELLPSLLLGEQKKLIFMSSSMGSIGENQIGNCYQYRSSKSALNMAIKTLAIELAAQGVTAIVLHPGWVKTDMGGAAAPLDVAESVTAQRRVIAGLTPADTGRFLDYLGNARPW